MIRKVKTYPKVKQIYPFLIWRKCNFCNNEFVREKGYIIEDERSVKSNTLSPTIEYYCCCVCAGNGDEVRLLIDKKKKDFRNLRDKLRRKG